MRYAAASTVTDRQADTHAHRMTTITLAHALRYNKPHDGTMSWAQLCCKIDMDVSDVTEASIRVILFNDPCSVQFAYFLTFLASLTVALVLAARKPDSRQYDTPVDVFRGLCEAFTLLTICYNTVGEINQMRM